MALVDEVKTRYGGSSSSMLIQLTNWDATETTINEDVLQAACDDATGMFEDITGLTLDIAQKNHLYIAAQAAILFLEEYKSRDSGILSGRRKIVFAAMKGIREKLYVTAQTNSKLKPSTELSNILPDMDKNRAAFSGYTKRTVIEEYAEEE